MTRSRGFTFTEMAASVVLALMLMAATQAIMGCDGGLSRARRNARQMQSSTQVRGIIQGMINYSPGNYELYPGLRRGPDDPLEDTTALPPGINNYGSNVTGYFPAYRYALMLRNSYFTPDYAISPAEVDAKITPASLGGAKPGLVTVSNYSFAMLEIASGGGRELEWQSTTNSMAVVASDRNLGPNSGTGAGSVHDQTKWQGTAGYNDNHVVFETAHQIPGLRYGQSNPSVVADNLFSSGDALERPAGLKYPEPDALMTYKNQSDGGVNQKP